MKEIRMGFCVGASVKRIIPGNPLSLFSPTMHGFILKESKDDEFGFMVPCSEFHLDCFNAKVHKRELPWKLSYHFFEEADEDYAGIHIRKVVIDRIDHVEEEDVDILSASMEYEKDGVAFSRRVLPAEGIVLATYAGAGIFVTEDLFEEHKIPISFDKPDRPPLLPPGNAKEAPISQADETEIENMRKKLEENPGVPPGTEGPGNDKS